MEAPRSERDELSSLSLTTASGEPAAGAPTVAAEPDYRRFAPPPNYRHPKKSHRKWLFVFLALLLLAVIGAAAYKFWKSSTKPLAKPAAAAAPKALATTGTTTSGAVTYTAAGQDINLSFSYPSSWTASPASGSDKTDQPITVTSPLLTLNTADSQSVTGKIVITIRPGNSSLDELNSNNPTAALASSQFSYTAPTPQQHQYPYLTYVHFSNGSKVPGVFEEVIVTGIQSFNKGDPVTAIGADPVISASFYQCTSQACSGSSQQPLSITSSNWQNDAPFQQVQSLLASLKFN